MEVAEVAMRDLPRLGTSRRVGLSTALSTVVVAGHTLGRAVVARLIQDELDVKPTRAIHYHDRMARPQQRAHDVVQQWQTIDEFQTAVRVMGLPESVEGGDVETWWVGASALPELEKDL